jgi:hypothetical protein
MACPLFLPASPLTGFHSEAAPLGDLYGGKCAADADALIPLDVLRRCCNAGYARDTCERAAQSDTDAFRFLIKAAHGGIIDVAWSSERNHHPVAVGTLAVNSAASEAALSPLERQASAYASAFVRQTGGQIHN